MKSNLPKKNRPEKLIKSANLFPVVGIGASAGGLEAFKSLLKSIPEDSGMAYVLVQHLAPNHESLLPEILQKVTPIPVLEITDDMKVLPDHIYVIPSNKMMVATDGVLLLAPRPEKSKTERSLPIDLFFTSLAEVHQEHAIGVVLSGTASDGTLGLKAIKEHGGITFAQDEASAEYEGMPHSAAQAGVVDFILPPHEIPNKLLEVTSKIKLSDEELQNIPKEEEDVFKQILSLLRIRKGVDFTYYKHTTIRRRILRRMVVNKNEEASEYLTFLRGNNPEQDLLFQDLLIPVTSFFRDKKVFENLCNHVFPAIIKNKIPGEITRVWVAGCSTGQEVYSFAICFKEFLGDNHERIQIFGTDLSEPAIAKARTGMYEKSDVDAISPERLKEYFTKTNGGYQINKSIRDLCVFAHHNFLKDPPFGKMDCISCRNALIYMEPYLQKKALTTFHYALNPKGFLLLGKSETTSGVPDLFAAVEKNDKLYTRKDVPGRFMQVVSQRSEQVLSRAIDPSKVETIRTDFQKTADDILLTKYTPAGVVINEAMDIVHFRGNTANYLEQAPGKPSHNLLMMAKSGLGFELRNILHKAKTDKAAVVKENIPLSVNGSIQNISIEAIPLPNTLEPYYLILFHNNSVNGADWLATSNKKKVSAKTKKDEKDIQIQLLEQELAQAREDMRSITEEQEASNEELQSANEELLSGSEELQSLNEELETSKEELQSTNEELTVLNHELTGLNEQVTDARNYSESIVATLYQPLLVLDKHLRVKTANKAFYKTFNVNEQETEGVLIYDLGNRQWNIPELRTLLEEILPQKKQITDFEVIHNFTSIGERVILLSALEITREKKEEKLILLSIEDITEKSFARKKIEDSEKRYNMMLMKSPFAFAVLKGKNMVITIANDSVKEMWGKGKDLEGKPLLEVLPELKDSEFPSLLDNVYTTGTPFTGEALLASVFRNGKLEDVYFNFVYQPYLEADETISGVTIIAIEVTNEVIAKQKIKDSQQQLQNIFMQAPFALNIYEGKELVISLANKLFCEIIGKTESEILGKKLFDAFPETATQGLDKIISDIFSTGIPFKGNEFPVHFSKHGNEFKGYFDFIYQPIFDYNKNVSGVINVAVDVTDKVLARKKIEESEQRFHNLIYTSPSAIGILFGEDLVITIANEPIIEIWGKGKEIIGKKYFEALPELAEQGYKEVFNQVYKTGIPFNAIETPVNILQNGVATLKYYNFILYPQKDINGEINGIGIIASEVTSQAKYNLQIKESEERFRLLVMQAPVSIFVLRGEDFIIETMNQEMANFLDRKIEDSLNKPLFDVITEVKDQNYKKLLDTVYKTGTRYVSHELPLIINRNGRLENIFLKFVYEPLREADGTISGVMVLADEITDQVNARKAVEVSEKRFRLLTNNMPQKITNADAEGNVNFFNQQWIDDTGLSFDELMDDGWVKAMHPDDLELTVNNWKHSVATGDDFDMECRIQNKEGYYRWHLSRAVPIRDENGRIVMWVGSNTDIHEQKEQRELLETAVEKRTVELNKANKKLVHESLEKEKRADELIKINKELEAFTYVSSHDLQEPLRKIHIFAGRILEKENEKLSDTGKKYFHIMQDSASRMQTLIEDLLTFSGLSSAERKFEIKDLTDIIEKIKIELKESIEEKQAIIEIGELCPANIIVFQFHQLMQNLISNALKFSKPKYPPHIIIKSSMVEGSKVKKHKLSSEKKYCHITVTDNGIGFEKKFSEKIFEVFQKLHSKEEYTGTGIGLAIVRKIVDNHNGMITATSKLNKGTSFDIYIPANQNK